MLATFSKAQLATAGPHDLSDALEAGRIVCFPESPLELPSPEDLEFLRQEMPKHLSSKNISFHPEVDKIIGIKGSREIVERAQRILKEHNGRVQDFLKKSMPSLVRNWMVGTASFRPLQEKGRDLPTHASNEIVHVDAGAYGATHGDGIIRFFVNVNPVEDRVWVTKGAFPDLYRRYGAEARVLPQNGANGSAMDEGMLDRLRTSLSSGLSALVPSAKFLDSSPYDRAMRRFHNYMKDTPAFQSTSEGHQEFRFKPFWAWMVFTDRVSHACISGQHAFADTFVVRLGSCRLPEMAPINILKTRPA
ncbi:MAG: Kdo hydroxylase family protein [Planctomycetes bacterium]|nr:Kdo hydroxylase family protein [Planctomycetota bacterium]